jgi:CubicO group peptidase (beta-lactamase class C family)
MTRTTKATATGWLLLCFWLCGGCEDDVPIGGTDAGSGDGDADADGDADPYAAITAAYEAERVANGVPGVAVAIVENGELAWSQGFGNKDVDAADAVTPDTRFRYLNWGFPALALLQLVDQGLVELDDPLIDHVPVS